jgi:hypothetical protein
MNMAAVPKAAAFDKIDMLGGPVMAHGANVYFIWYGNWTGTTALSTQNILTYFVQNVGGSPLSDILTTYYDRYGNRIRPYINYRASVYDYYSQGKSLSDATVRAAVVDAISSHSLPADENGIYFVMPSSDVSENSGACGWHHQAVAGGIDLKYAWVGSQHCLGFLPAVNLSVSPNGNPIADEMASILAHEIFEAITDPHLAQAYIDTSTTDSAGNHPEMADKCSDFGTTFTVISNGSQANVLLGSKYFLIQRMWSNNDGISGLCAQSSGEIENVQLIYRLNDREVWRINTPNVNQASTPYDSIPLRKGDTAFVQAGGCVQIGGNTPSWHPYVDAAGSSGLYHASIQLPGMSAVQSIGNFIRNHPSGMVLPQDGILQLGYADDGRSDNGYYKHDDGPGNACGGVGNAWVQLTISHPISITIY